MSQLIQDVFIVENLQILSEGTAGKTKIRGVFGRCNEANKNGRIYPTAVLESQLKKVQPLISERRLCGELDHPQNDTVKLSNASHLITKLEMKGDELIGEAEILSTPAGMTAKALIEGGVKIGISSRGMGTLSEDAKGNKIVNEDFRLVTFDLVADPSTRGAYPGLSESVESQFVSESTSVREKESNFLTLLEARLRESYSPLLVEKKASKCKECKKADCECGEKKGKSFPDLTGDGKVTKADILKGRGVIPESVVGMAGKLADAFGSALEEMYKIRQRGERKNPNVVPSRKSKTGEPGSGTKVMRADTPSPTRPKRGAEGRERVRMQRTGMGSQEAMTPRSERKKK